MTTPDYLVLDASMRWRLLPGTSSAIDHGLDLQGLAVTWRRRLTRSRAKTWQMPHRDRLVCCGMSPSVLKQAELIWWASSRLMRWVQQPTCA